MSEPINQIIVEQIDALLFNETNTITNLSNASALLKSEVTDINWAGFYLYNEHQDELVLGPFQGNVACMHIKNGTGVCGTSFKEDQILRVKNVHEFPGHIACDSASNSEIVLPLTVNGQKIGVLDIDSPTINRFDAEDEAVLANFRDALVKHIDSSILSALN
ncbi:GAF domain-containing protein [Pediococcus stilesii]|uniref:GAF domain-containing protein n=1 Tax=Pediococcus stilesii TaxID=331679 RepID=A0A5R9BXB5_9LACO|nr:GAF domain-containing protein [Pediococcus stilesii]TLQ05374.1 GAF domain-containing protein [Pediococcus stilesii]